MASFLASVGRADIPQAIQTFQQNESNRAITDQTLKLQKIQEQSAQQDVEIKKRQMEKQLKKEQDMLKPIPLEVLGSAIEGGWDSPMGQTVYKLADGMGYIDKSSGVGMGDVQKDKVKEVFKMMHEPEIASQLASQRVNYWRDQYTAAEQAVREKPEDQKALAAMQNAKTRYMQAVGQNKALMDGMKAMAAKKAESGGFTLGQGQARYDAEGNLIASGPEKPIEGAPQPTPTDIDDFVADAETVFKANNPNATKEQLAEYRNKARLQFKRAQQEEVAANRFAERNVDSMTAEKIKFNEKIGTMLAEIAKTPDLIEAKGEITPQKKKQNAQLRMSGNLASLANKYVDLDSTGAMLNVDNSTLENVTAAMRSSTVGQMFGRITGTNEQSIRSSIKKIKPLLIQDIRQATDMGARGLDSEKELEFYLQAATDEKTDIQSNIAAIVVLDEAYGDGRVAEQLRSLTNESLIRRISEEGNAILNPKTQQTGGAPKNITTPEEYKTLKPGETYIWEGKSYVKGK